MKILIKLVLQNCVITNLCSSLNLYRLSSYHTDVRTEDRKEQEALQKWRGVTVTRVTVSFTVQ